MKPHIFNKVLIAVTVLCLIATITHIVYAVDAYQHCSIIYFIAKELW